jgi:hypothetical protein
MSFVVNNSPPSLREIKFVISLAEDDFDSLDRRELWIYENYCQGGFL